MCSEHVSDDLELNGKVFPRQVWGSLTLGRVTLRRKILGLGTGIRGKCDNGSTHLSHLGSEGATDKWEVPKCPGGRPESESVVLFRVTRVKVRVSVRDGFSLRFGLVKFRVLRLDLGLVWVKFRALAH